MHRTGFMQGRLSPQVDGKIQAFPWRHWRDEFRIGAEAGFSLMEWTLDDEGIMENPFMTSTGRREIRALSSATGVSVESLTGDCFMQRPFWKTTGETNAALLSTFRTVIEAGADLGVSLIVVPLVDNGRIENEQQLQTLIEGIAPLQSVLERYNLKVVFESDLSPLQLRDFIKQFPDGCCGINYDIGNSASLGFLPQEEIGAYGARIFNVHVKDRELGGSTVPLGSGNADFPAVFKALRNMRYEGNLILQTARAIDGDHVGVLVRYRAMVEGWLMSNGNTQS